MNKFNIDKKALDELITLCERAEKLGLEFIKDKKKQYQFWICEPLGVQVEACKYDLTTWSQKRESKNNSGHTMITVWIKHEAEVLLGHIDLYIADSNPNRYTEIGKSIHTSTSIEDLKWFIKTHSKGRL